MKIKFHALHSIVISVISACPLLLPTVAYNGSEEVGHTGAGIGAFLWCATPLRQMHVRRMYVCRELTRTQENKHSAQIVCQYEYM
ncbi:hypothetical protein V8C43DRAFT_275587 [Trichoderma afarasin]